MAEEYRSVIHEHSGVGVGLWRPRITNDGRVVLLLGRAPSDWYGGGPSGQARALVDQGYWVVTVNTPNWGNQTDMTAISSALSWAESNWQRDIDRLLIVAHGDGAVAALNWGMRNHQKVASVSLLAPIIDLAERYARVAADQASMEAAYGGDSTTFNAAMPTWNPAHLHRKYMIKDLLGTRLAIHYSTSDTDTPPAVTTDLAADFAITPQTMSNTDPTLIPAEPIALEAANQDTNWDQQASQVEQRRWMDLIDNQPAYNYRGGDMTDSVALDDGRVIWIGSDIFAGGVDADGTLAGILPFRNAILIQDSAGNFTSRVYQSGTGGVAFSPDYNIYDSSWIYWAIACIAQGTTMYVGCWIVSPEGTYGQPRDSHIVAFDTTDFSVISRTPMNLTENKFFIDGFVEDGAYTYAYGEEFIPRYGPFDPAYGLPSNDPQGVTHKHVARVPTASITNVGLYEFWTGSGWTSNEVDMAAMVDSNSAIIEGDADVYKIGENNFILAGRTFREPNLRVYQATTPYGPWTQYATVPTPDVSDLRYGGVSIGQIGKFTPHVDTPAGTIQYAICPNMLGVTEPIGNRASMSFVTRFFTVPLPS